MNKTCTQNDVIEVASPQMTNDFLDYQEIQKLINETLTCPSDYSVNKILDYSIKSGKVGNSYGNLN